MNRDHEVNSYSQPLITSKINGGGTGHGGHSDLDHLILSGVKLTDCLLGQGSYGTVYKSEHNGIPCAAKKLDLDVLELVDAKSEVKSQGQVCTIAEELKQNFLLECFQHSKLRHPNIVTMLGIFYPKDQTIPVLVMELMECNLTQLLEDHQNICMYVKLSILQDVSRGLCYLHTQNPPIVHQALYSDNILLTKGLTAKIADLKAQVLLSPRQNMRSNDFLPYSDDIILNYRPSLNVFSYGCVMCHIITQRWPTSSDGIQNPARVNVKSAAILTRTEIRSSISLKRKLTYTDSDWSVKKHQTYIDQINDNSLHQLAEACLQCKSKNRPHMSLVYERITSIMTAHCCNDDNIKNIYSLVMKQGLDQSMNFQLMLVGAENTGKTSLISSFLGEEFVERQSTTKADMEVCKVYCKDWVRISHIDKSNMLRRQFTDHCKESILRKMSDSYMPLSSKPQYQSDGLIASLWDFTGQAVFHNSHSVFISESGVTVITFNASMKCNKDQIIPHNFENFRQSYECRTIISSIHYWLQVVNSVCSVKENVLLVGTHIDKLHPDLKEARKIASNIILPVLEEELCGKCYAQHIACISKGLKIALEQSCFFVSNKCWDEEIANLQNGAVKVAASLREEKPIFFLKIEQALLQLNKQIITVSTMLDLVAKNGLSFNKNSPEFKGILKHFHNNRIILYFSQIESLKDLVILSPNWLAKLFSYVIAAHSYITGSKLDWAWKRLTNYGILHECLLQHMLDKFHSDHQLDSIRITKKQTVDVLLHFHLLARITSKAWFAEEGLGFPQPSERGDTFIVPSLARVDDRNPPKSDHERIIYLLLNDGFISTSLLNQLIAECICRSVRRNDQLLWMRRGKMGSQLGAHQKYYISRCEDNQSIQLTITVVGDDEEHIKERRDLINDIIKLLDDIMKVYMPATKEKPLLLIPCELCRALHIPLDDVRSGKTIFCPNTDDQSLTDGYYSDLLQDATTIAGVGRKLEVFMDYYYKLSRLDFKLLGPHLVTARVINYEDNDIVQKTNEPSKAASYVLNKISDSLEGGTDAKFDKFLSILKNDDDLFHKFIANQIWSDLSRNITVVTLPTPCSQLQTSYEEFNSEDLNQMSSSEEVGWKCNLM